MVGGVKCLPDIDVICGNGILEPGEECDGDSCCGSNCMFLPTAYCSYQYFTAGTDGSKVLITNECCNSKCKPTGTNLCDKGDSDSTKSVDQGYCWNGEFQCVIYFNLYFLSCSDCRHSLFSSYWDSSIVCLFPLFLFSSFRRCLRAN